jgi:hypothetical protein
VIVGFMAAGGSEKSQPAPRCLRLFPFNPMNKIGEHPMFRTSVGLAAIVLVSGTLATASAQTADGAHQPKLSRVKLTVEHLKEMRAKWIKNKPKLRVCRKEVKSKGLEGDNRWFYIEECMDRT